MCCWSSPSGSRFSFNDTDNWNTNSNASSHLCKNKTLQTVPLGKKTPDTALCGFDTTSGTKILLTACSLKNYVYFRNDKFYY